MAKRKTRKKEGQKDSFFSFVLLVVFTVFLFGSPLTLSSCGKTEEPVKQPLKKRLTKREIKKKAAKNSKKSISEKIEVSEIYSYDATGKPDPFLPLFTETVTQKMTIPQKKSKPGTPLQKYALNELNLVAIISSENHISALFEDPSKYGYIVKDGTLIGKNEGIIKKITENGIIIEEKFYNSMGKLETKILTLTIQHQE